MTDRPLVLVGSTWVDADFAREVAGRARREIPWPPFPRVESEEHLREFPFDLGAGVRAYVEWGHGAGTTVKLSFPTIGLLRFDFDPVHKACRGWTLVSASPLEIHPSITVEVGGYRIHGFVRGGRWGDTGNDQPGGTHRVELT